MIVREPFMPTMCWIAPLMPSARYSLGATVCPEDPTWRSIGSQPESQMGRDAARSPPSVSASCLASSIFFCSLMPRPTDTMISACVRSTACLASLKTSCGLVRMTPSATSTFMLEAHAVADHCSFHSRDELGDKVAHLVGVRHEHELRLLRCQELFERYGESIGSVRLELRRLNRINLRNFFRRDFRSDRSGTGADYRAFESPSGGGCDRLSRRDGLPGNAIQLAFALLDNDQDRIRHKEPNSQLSSLNLVIPNRREAAVRNLLPACTAPAAGVRRASRGLTASKPRSHTNTYKTRNSLRSLSTNF